MKSRARAIVFALGALACAGLSAALAGSGRAPAGEGLDDLRPVVVSTAPLARGAVIGRAALRTSLAERRVPLAFAPPDTLGLAAEALGRRLAVPLPAGSYLTAAHLKVARDRTRKSGGPPRGTTPVEITVTGAGALAVTQSARGEAVDVVVAGEPAPGAGAGRTYLAAEQVPLLALRKARAETGLPADRWIATLALTRAQALRLIRAEGVARSIRLLAQ